MAGSGIAATMLDELVHHPDRVYQTFEIDLSETYRFSDQYVGSASAGMYLKRVLNWGDFSRPFADRSCHLQDASGSVEVEDQAEDLAREIGGPSRGAVRNAPARAHWRSPAVAAADHFKFYEGRVQDWSLSGWRRYQFYLGPDRLALDAKTNNIRKISKTDWTDAPERSYDKPGQAVYGKHRSSALAGSTGLIQCIPVDDVNDSWYVSIGRLPLNLVNVWRSADGADYALETLSQWTMEYRLVSGIYYTVVSKTGGTPTDQALDEIRIDCDGIELDGDGSSLIIDTPLSQLQHFLTNFVFNAWPAGATNHLWLATSAAPINSTLLSEAETTLTARGYLASRALTTLDRGIDVLNECCAHNQVGPFWAANWKLGFAVLDPAIRALLDIEAAYQLRFEDQVGRGEDISGTPRTDAFVSQISVSWIRDAAAGQLRRGPVTVADTKLPIVSEDLDLGWVQAALVS